MRLIAGDLLDTKVDKVHEDRGILMTKPGTSPMNGPRVILRRRVLLVSGIAMLPLANSQIGRGEGASYISALHAVTTPVG